MSESVNVLHVLNSSGGGATQCALELIKGLAGSRYIPFIAAPSEPGRVTRQECESLDIQWHSMPIGWWNRKTRLSWPRRIAWAAAQNLSTRWNIRTVYRLVRLIKERKIDIVHTHTCLNPWGAVAARITGVRHVWHVHEPNGQGKPFTYWLPDSALALTLGQLSDYVVCVSKYVAELFLKHPQQTPVEVLYQGIDVSSFSESTAESSLRKSLGVGEDEIMIGMVAGLTSTWKRHDLFVEMSGQLAAKAPKARFVIFGDLPKTETRWLYGSAGEYARSIIGKVEELGLSDRVLFAGHHSDVPAIMSAIDILVHPCEVEGFGRVAIEAMAAGRPVVGPDRGGISESVVDGETGLLFPAGDSEALSASCLQLIENSELRQRLGANGRIRASKLFDVHTHIDKIARIYDQVSCHAS